MEHYQRLSFYSKEVKTHRTSNGSRHVITYRIGLILYCMGVQESLSEKPLNCETPSHRTEGKMGTKEYKRPIHDLDEILPQHTYHNEYSTRVKGPFSEGRGARRDGPQLRTGWAEIFCCFVGAFGF